MKLKLILITLLLPLVGLAQTRQTGGISFTPQWNFKISGSDTTWQFGNTLMSPQQFPYFLTKWQSDRRYSPLIDALGVNTPTINKTLSTVSNTGNLKKFFSGDLSTKKIAFFGNSIVDAAPELFSTLAKYAVPGKVLNGLPVTPVTYKPITGFVDRVGNIYNEGHNGYDLATMLTNGDVDSLIARNYDMIIIVGPLMNDVRLGQVGLDSCRKLISTMLTRINTALPNTVVILETENSILSTDPTSTGLLTTIATTETKVNGGTGGIPSAGSYTIQFAVKPTSFINNGDVYINFGLGDQETVKITALTDTTFVATFTQAHAQGFAIKATMATTAQAYTNIVREAVLPFANSYPNLSLLDMQQLEYGTVSQPTTPLMLNQLHPNSDGRILNSTFIGEFLTQAQYRISQYAATNVVNNFVNGQIFGIPTGQNLTKIVGGTSGTNGGAGLNFYNGDPTNAANIIGTIGNRSATIGGSYSDDFVLYGKNNHIYTSPTTRLIIKNTSDNGVDDLQLPGTAFAGGYKTSTNSGAYFLATDGTSKTFGTGAGTIAQGNDSRINNGQTAFGWGNPAGVYYPLAAGFSNPLSNNVYINTATGGSAIWSKAGAAGVWYMGQNTGTGGGDDTYGLYSATGSTNIFQAQSNGDIYFPHTITTTTQTAGDNSTKVATTAYVDGRSLSGTYTPTATNISNVSSSTPSATHYVRVGDMVTVTGRIDFVNTGALTGTVIELTLPIASNFGVYTDCSGVGQGTPNITNGITQIIFDANASNDKATLTCWANSYIGSQIAYFTFTYKVI